MHTCRDVWCQGPAAVRDAAGDGDTGGRAVPGAVHLAAADLAEDGA